MNPNPPEAPEPTRLEVLAQAYLIPGESTNNLADFLRDYEDAFQPRSALERHLVEDILSAAWRKYRLSVLETYLLRWQMQLEIKANPGYNEGAGALNAYRSLADHSRALQLIALNITRSRNEFHKASRHLLDLRARLPRRRSTNSEKIEK